MSDRKHFFTVTGFVLSASLITAVVSVLLTSYHYSRQNFHLLNEVCCEMIEQEPETQTIISAALKEYTGENPDGVLEKEVLAALGYQASDFCGFRYRQDCFFAALGFLSGASLFLVTFFYRNREEGKRIQALAEYLEQADGQKAMLLSALGEDDFSRLEDEIYKTVTFLYQTREQAVQAKNDFAENLSNIAHQIKTPIAAISLSVQRWREGLDCCAPDQVERQLSRLTYLTDSLLILSRLDAGTLLLQKEEADVYTLLVLAADNLQELFSGSGTSIDIPEQGEMPVLADVDWTMEAIMNLMKNCMEHHEGGTVHCCYSQNPLYTEIRIWDDGEGFAQEDIPHLFERFYRGKNAGGDGIGIGLALAKEIIERQNGTIRADNRPEGGALFEIRFYSH